MSGGKDYHLSTVTEVKKVRKERQALVHRSTCLQHARS